MTRPDDVRLSYDLGTDHKWDFPVLNAAETEAVNVSGWAFSFRIKRSVEDADANALYLVTSPAITIEGVYNPDPALNTQQVVVPIADTDSDTWDRGAARWELKRIDPGFESIIRRGPMHLYRTVHRE